MSVFHPQSSDLDPQHEIISHTSQIDPLDSEVASSVRKIAPVSQQYISIPTMPPQPKKSVSFDTDAVSDLAYQTMVQFFKPPTFPIINGTLPSHHQDWNTLPPLANIRISRCDEQAQLQNIRTSAPQCIPYAYPLSSLQDNDELQLSYSKCFLPNHATPCVSRPDHGYWQSWLRSTHHTIRTIKSFFEVESPLSRWFIVDPIIGWFKFVVLFDAWLTMLCVSMCITTSLFIVPLEQTFHISRVASAFFPSLTLSVFAFFVLLAPWFTARLGQFNVLIIAQLLQILGYALSSVTRHYITLLLVYALCTGAGCSLAYSVCSNIIRGYFIPQPSSIWDLHHARQVTPYYSPKNGLLPFSPTIDGYATSPCANHNNNQNCGDHIVETHQQQHHHHHHQLQSQKQAQTHYQEQILFTNNIVSPLPPSPTSSSHSQSQSETSISSSSQQSDASQPSSPSLSSMPSSPSSSPSLSPKHHFHRPRADTGVLPHLSSLPRPQIDASDLSTTDLTHEQINTTTSPPESHQEPRPHHPSHLSTTTHHADSEPVHPPLPWYSTLGSSFATGVMLSAIGFGMCFWPSILTYMLIHTSYHMAFLVRAGIILTISIPVLLTIQPRSVDQPQTFHIFKQQLHDELTGMLEYALPSGLQRELMNKLNPMPPRVLALDHNLDKPKKHAKSSRHHHHHHHHHNHHHHNGHSGHNISHHSRTSRRSPSRPHKAHSANLAPSQLDISDLKPSSSSSSIASDSSLDPELATQTHPSAQRRQRQTPLSAPPVPPAITPSSHIDSTQTSSSPPISPLPIDDHTPLPSHHLQPSFGLHPLPDVSTPAQKALLHARLLACIESRFREIFDTNFNKPVLSSGPFRSGAYCIIFVIVLVNATVFYLPYMHLIPDAIDHGARLEEIPSLFFTLGVSSLICRLIFCYSSSIVHPLYLLIIALSLQLAAAISWFYCQTTFSFHVCAFLYGLSTGGFLVSMRESVQFLVFDPSDDIQYGIAMLHGLAMAPIAFIVGPVFGLIYHTTGSYLHAKYITTLLAILSLFLGCCLLFIGINWRPFLNAAPSNFFREIFSTPNLHSEHSQHIETTNQTKQLKLQLFNSISSSHSSSDYKHDNGLPQASIAQMPSTESQHCAIAIISESQQQIMKNDNEDGDDNATADDDDNDNDDDDEFVNIFTTNTPSSHLAPTHSFSETLPQSMFNAPVDSLDALGSHYSQKLTTTTPTTTTTQSPAVRSCFHSSPHVIVPPIHSAISTSLTTKSMIGDRTPASIIKQQLLHRNITVDRTLLGSELWFISPQAVRIVLRQYIISALGEVLSIQAIERKLQSPWTLLPPSTTHFPTDELSTLPSDMSLAITIPSHDIS